MDIAHTITETIILIAGLTGMPAPTQLDNLIKIPTPSIHNSEKQTTSETGLLTAVFGETVASPIANGIVSTDPIDWLRSELAMYGSLEEGWDGPGSVPPSPDHIEDAIAFIEYLPAGIPIPNPMLSSTGEVGFYWNRESTFSDIVFEGHGQFSLFVRDKKAPYQEQFQEDLLISQIAPAWLAEQLNSL